MGRIVKFIVVGALIGLIGKGVMLKNASDEGGEPITRASVLSSDTVFDEIEEKGALGYVADNTKKRISSMGGGSDGATMNDWETGFINARSSLDGKMMLIDQHGLSIIIGEDESQYTRIKERQRVLSPITVVEEWTEEDLFNYIRDYKQRGFLATQALEEELKAKTKCEYDLRFDYVFIDKDSIYLTMLWDNGTETDMAISMSEGVAFAKSLLDYI